MTHAPYPRYASYMEWLQNFIERAKQWLTAPPPKKPEPVPSHEPLQLAEGTPLKASLDRLHAKIKADFPHVPMPPLRITTNFEAYKATYGKDGRFQASYVPSESAVILDPILLTLLTPDELTTVIAHEYGHHFNLKHFGDNRHSLNQLRGVAGITSVSAYLRSNECEADQFAGHYVPSARSHLISALSKMRTLAGSDPQAHTHIYHTHPADPIRLAGREAQKAIAMKPGTVTFDGLCNALFPSPPLRPVAPPPGTLSREANPSRP